MDTALSLNENLYEIKFNGRTLDLTPREYDLLTVLMQESQRVTGRAELLRKVWVDGKPLIRVVDTYICRLRAKLQDAGHPGISVARKRGYRLIETDGESKVAI
ncbi:winged helix-turn-helix transcriptional regulator [Dehalococcoides mccartyi]|nr:winged helix-turn-helix transcriptional regulator [Dehalococcoides mccartyi]